ncbi:MAG: tape measure protein [Clostridiales bacterium]|nr:tape measure protein [Clostridiales bacterium]
MATLQSVIKLQDNFSSVMNGIIDSVNLGFAAIENLQGAMNGSVDASSFEGAREAINQASAAALALDAQLERMGKEPVEIPFVWQNDSLDVFTGTGVERYEQEIQSANSMLNSLYQTQTRIAQNAAGTSVFSGEALSDISSLQSRIEAVRERILQIESNPLNIGTEGANSQLEHLRGQLAGAVTLQEELNNAVDNLDIQGANTAYLRLSNTISGTEGYIRDNVNEQGVFNDAVSEGTERAAGLEGMIKRAAASYLGIQSVKKVIEISDDLTSTTARLELMNDGLQTTEELNDLIYQSAQNARGSYSDMADLVARFGNNAGDAFGSSEEVVAFANLIQKQMTIAGATTEEAANAELQLSQALGSGVLRGDELNSIFEQAPNLIQSIADYMGVPLGQIRDMASEGQITADIVKAAVFASADDINEKFESMPMTWGQVWTGMSNTALNVFRGILQKVNDIANSNIFQGLVSGATAALSVIASVLSVVFNVVEGIGSFIIDNWSIISPVILGIAAALAVYNATMGIAWLTTLKGAAAAIKAGIAAAAHAVSSAAETAAIIAMTIAQEGLNAAIAMCPVSWIIIAIIALIAVIFAVCAAIAKFTGITDSAFGVICGVILTALAVIWKGFQGILDFALGIINYLINGFIDFANFLANVFNDPIATVIHSFGDMVDQILGLLETVARVIDKVFGSSLADSVSGWRSGLNSKIEAAAEKYGNGSYEKIIEEVNLNSELLGINRVEYGTAFEYGSAFGDGISDKISGLFDFGGDENGFDMDEIINNANSALEGLGGSLDSIDENTADMASELKQSDDIIDMIKDSVSRERIVNYTTKEIKVDMSGMSNSIASSLSINDIINQLRDRIIEEAAVSAEGV